MLRLLPLLLFIAAACVLAPTADAARTCRSGDTVYKHGGVRVFKIGGDDDFWFACGPHTRRPTPLYSATGGYASFGVIGRSGDKVLLEGEFSGEGGGEDTTIGWFDARTSQARSGDLAGSVSNEVLDVVVTTGGSIGVVAGLERDQGVTVGYLTPSRRKGELTGELVLATAGGRYVRGSLAFADGERTLAWKLDDGQVRSAPVTGEAVTCTSGTTLVESDGARVFEVLPRRRTERGFQADVLAACPRGAATPRELAVSDVYDQDHWDIRSLKRTGSRIAFLAGATGVGLLDGVSGDVRFAEPKDIQWVQDVAAGSAGEPVFAGYPPEGGFGGQRLVARLTAETATTFGGWERLATQGGDVADASLAVGDDGRVTWRTSAGLAQSTPLAGETTLDCTTGTTLVERDGLRVFEQLPAGADDGRLFACAPGAVAPLLLLTGPRNSSWKVVELARENGRVALYAGIVSGGIGDLMISFDAGRALVGDPGPSNAYGTIRDVAIAPDGRVAVALKSGRRWAVTAFALGGASGLRRERTLAKPADGVRAGTLAFSADGSRVLWLGRSGTAHSAAV